MKPKHLDRLILDFGNIIATFDHEKALQALADRAQVAGITGAQSVRQVAGECGWPNELESGSISPRLFFERMREALMLELSFSAFAEIWGDIFIESPGIEGLLERIKPRVKMVVCSNTDPIHWTTIEQLPVMRRFFSDPRRLVRSYDAGVRSRKPDRKIFEVALERIGSFPRHTLLVDDMDAYCRFFQDEMGGTAERYDCSKEPLSRLETILRGHEMLD
jgi:FMN phosphatase YigB (HAD superfamily)